MRTDRPGYQRRVNKDGSVAHYWNPKRAVKGAPDYLTIRRLDESLDDDGIVQECRRLTTELQKDLANLDAPPSYDGTIKALIDLYKWDKSSSLHSVKHSTRIRDYEPSLRVLAKNVGDRSISKLKASDFKTWYAKWRRKGHRRASGAIKLLRIILSYGSGEKLPACSTARGILSDIRFEQPPSREIAMTYEQCLAIVLKSQELKCPSIGFVEALKFESALRRIDVIGEWEPSEDGGPFKWTGPTAKNLSKDLVLSIKTSKTGSDAARDLKVMPLVTEALKSYRIPDIGPLVIDEDHGKPYWENRYAEKYRTVRDAAGVPSNVWSMDSRAGAVSETVEATGSLEDARVLATHTTTKTTQRYNRGNGLDASRKIAEARTKKRL